MQKLFKGSALVYTLIMMLFLMVGALALMTTTIIQQRGVSGTTESVRAFQLANDGFEDVIAKYNRGASNLSGLVGTGGTCNATTGTATVTNTIATGSYTATFTDSNNTAIANCATPLSDVVQVKVVSTIGSSTRAIEAAFATGRCSWHNADSSVTGSVSLSPEPAGACRFTAPETGSYVWHGNIFHNHTGFWSCGVLTKYNTDDISWKNNTGAYNIIYYEGGVNIPPVKEVAGTDTTQRYFEYLSCD